jgi:CelD/BcsL family acetyltransferase involved in cellulose biosynthesis
MIRIQSVTKEQDFIGLRNIWNKLLEESGSNIVFLTYEWVSTWWSFFRDNKELLILLLYDGGELVGIAPLFRTKTFFRKVEIIGSAVADYQDFIIVKKREECINAIFKFLYDQSWGWDIIEIPRVLETSPNHALIVDKLGEYGNGIRYEMRGIAPFLSMKGYSWEEYYNGLKKHFRRTLQKRLQNLEQVGYLVQLCNSKHMIERFMNSLFEFKVKQFRRKNSVNFLRSNRLRQFYMKIAREFHHKQWLDCGYLAVGGDIAASHLDFIYGNKRYSYLTAFDFEKFPNYSVGRILQLHLLKRSFANHLEEFDFLLGGEKYKFDWTKSIRNLYRLCGFGHTVRGEMLRLWHWNIKPLILSHLPSKFTRQSKTWLAAASAAVENLATHRKDVRR